MTAVMKCYETPENAQKIIDQNNYLVYVLVFESENDEESQLMSNVIEKLEKAYDLCKFIRILTESGNSLSEKYNVKKIPTCVIIKNSKMVRFLEGLVPGELTTEVRKLVSTPSVVPYTEQLVNQEPIMVFIKGSPTSPRCGKFFTAKSLALVVK
ncbi:hypothetical protein HZS_6959 [Henneguya salminicola]|nr:hypothetical protein HZS_6959 [Henneguya salminicola]